MLEILEKPVKPFIKWPGGKTSELSNIADASPKEDFKRFIDPFVGGGSVLFAIPFNVPGVCNDICLELINLYKIGATGNSDFYKLADQFCNIWDNVHIEQKELSKVIDHFRKFTIFENKDLYIEIPKLQIGSFELFDNFMATFNKEINKKIQRTKKVSLAQNKLLPPEDIEKTVLMVVKSIIYTEIRNRYNFLRVNKIDCLERDLWFFFLREYAYASMFRFNSKNEFNVPYGGISYNAKKFRSKIQTLKSKDIRSRLENTTFYNLDYKEFLGEIKPKREDLIFIDPPYDSTFSDYDNVSFDRKQQIELRDYLESLNSKILIVIGETEFIKDLYSSSNWKINTVDKNYMWNIKSRNDGNTNHLIITNY